MLYSPFGHFYNVNCSRSYRFSTDNKHLCLIPSRVSGRGYKIGPVCLFVCLFVCPSVSALTAEPFHIRAQNLAQGTILTISRTSSKVKGQGRHGKKQFFCCFCSVYMCRFTVMTDGAIWHYTVMSRRNVRDITAWRPWRHSGCYVHDFTAWVCHGVTSCNTAMLWHDWSFCLVGLTDGVICHQSLC